MAIHALAKIEVPMRALVAPTTVASGSVMLLLMAKRTGPQVEPMEEGTVRAAPFISARRVWNKERSEGEVRAGGREDLESTARAARMRACCKLPGTTLAGRPIGARSPSTEGLESKACKEANEL
jgi:hypothetical protein